MVEKNEFECEFGCGFKTISYDELLDHHKGHTSLK